MVLHELGPLIIQDNYQCPLKLLLDLFGISTPVPFQPCSVALQSLLVSRYVENYPLLYLNPVLFLSRMYKADTSNRLGILYYKE